MGGLGIEAQIRRAKLPRNPLDHPRVAPHGRIGHERRDGRLGNVIQHPRILANGLQRHLLRYKPAVQVQDTHQPVYLLRVVLLAEHLQDQGGVAQRADNREIGFVLPVGTLESLPAHLRRPGFAGDAFQVLRVLPHQAHV